jgi:predicted lipoprotein with Yx(FWY)xxD motif
MKALLLLIAPLVLAACGTAGVASTGASTAPTPVATQTPTRFPTATPIPTPTPTATPAPVATPAPQHAAPSVFVAQNMHLGAVLVNPQSRTLYYFVPERGGHIVCTGSCTGAWPPLLTASMAPTASAALPGQLGVIARLGGEQVTYNHWPLYTFAGGSGPDQTNGQGIFGFGGKWFVATPNLQP